MFAHQEIYLKCTQTRRFYLDDLGVLLLDSLPEVLSGRGVPRRIWCVHSLVDLPELCLGKTVCLHYASLLVGQPT